MHRTPPLIAALLGVLVAGCPAHGPTLRAGEANPAAPERAPGPVALEPEEALVTERIGGVLRARLDNGLTVVLIENRAAPVVAIQVWVGAGSADEKPGEEGLAHLHEHMLFKGTERRGVGEIAQAIEGAGGEINAWTSFDHTVYHVVLARSELELGLNVLADAVLHPAFDSDELEREKLVVLEEIKHTRDTPGRHVGELLFQSAYRHHPYRHAILGTEASVQAVTRKSILAFFRRHYRPSRMTVVLAGDFEPPTALRRVRALFGQAARSMARRERPAEPGQRKLRVELVRDDIQEAHLALAWHIGSASDADTPALDLLAAVLGQGESGRLTLELKQGRELVNDVYAYAYAPEDPGLFVVGATCRPDQVRAALEAITEQVRRTARLPVGTAELAKAKAMIESDALYQRETVDGLARRVGYFQATLGDPGYGEVYQGRVMGLGAEDLLRVAGRIFIAGNLTAVVMLPQDKEPELAKSVIRESLTRGLQGKVEPVPAPERLGAGITRVQLPNGPTLLVQEDHSNALVSMRAVFLGGTRFETEESNGLYNLLAAMLTRGTAARKADDIAREIDAIAGSLGGFSGRNSFGLRAEFPARHFDRALALFADCLRNPSFPPRLFKRERELVLEEIAARDDNLPDLAFDLFAATLYRLHPYRFSAIGTRSSVAGLRREQLQELMKRYTPARMVLAVVGDVETDRVVEQVRSALTDGAAQPATRAAPAPESRPEAPRLALKHRSRAQAHVVIGFLGARLSGPDRYALDVLMAILAGQGGRLFVDLRDQRSLAYSLTGFSLEGIEPGYLAIYLGVAPTRVCEALEGVRLHLERLRGEPVAEPEIQRARRYLVGSQAISLQKSSARAAAMAFDELYGLGHANYLDYTARIEAVRAVDVQRVAREYLGTDAVVVTVIGPQDQLPELDGLGCRAAPQIPAP